MKETVTLDADVFQQLISTVKRDYVDVTREQLIGQSKLVIARLLDSAELEPAQQAELAKWVLGFLS